MNIDPVKHRPGHCKNAFRFSSFRTKGGRLHRGCDQPEPFDCEDGCLADLIWTVAKRELSTATNLRFQPVAFAMVSGKTRMVLCPCKPGMPR